jgi:hypothetical protein
MRITSDGNVGIGTGAPYLSKLHVMKSESGSAPNAILRIGNQGAGYTSRIILTDETTNDANISYLGATQSLGFGLGTSLSQMVLTSTGNVGIGTTSPSRKLHVVGGDVYVPTTSDTAGTGSFGGSSFEIRNSTTGEHFNIDIYNRTSSAWYTPFHIQNTGNVGIGTTSPSEKLTVLGSDATTFQGAGIYNSYTYGNADKAESRFNLGKLEGSTYQPMGAIGAFPTDNTNSGNGILSFYTRTSQSVTEKMRITSGGNVGIGTTSPTQGLHVSSAIGSANTGITIQNTSTGNPQLRFLNSSGTEVLAMTYISGTTSSLYIYTAAAGNLLNLVGANVGIGTTSPSQKLQVSGSTIINGTIYSGDGSISTSNSLQLQYDASSGDGVIASKSTGGNTTLALQTSNSGTTTTKLYITSAGNVGIGTTSPTNKLHVNGGSIFNQDGFLYMSNQFPIVWGAAVSIEGDNVAGTLTLKTESSHRIFINNVGNVGINTTAPQQLLHVLGATNGYMMVQGANDAGNAGIYFKKEDTTGTMDRTKGLIVFHTNVGSGFGRGHLGFCLNSADSNAIVSVSDEKFRMVDNGDFLADGDVVAYSTTISDERYKTNITPIESALDKVNQMRGVSFDWTAGRSGREFGVIAQEIEKIAPEVVSEKELLNGETMKTVSYTSLVPFLIESIKELTARVEELEQKLKQ